LVIGDAGDGCHRITMSRAMRMVGARSELDRFVA
jgi:hypothetical protein